MDAVAFGGPGSIDFSEIRTAVRRIPEVSARIREAQAAWDKVIGDGTCLFHQMMADDQSAFLGRNVKMLLSVATHLGLYDRYQNKHLPPQFLVGDIQNISAVNVITGEKTLLDMVVEMQAPKPKVSYQESTGIPVLNGHQFPKYQVYELKGREYKPTKMINPDLNELLPELSKKKSVKRMVSVGPGSLGLKPGLEYEELADVVLLDSIELDPMLSWFWPSVRAASVTA